MIGLMITLAVMIVIVTGTVIVYYKLIRPLNRMEEAIKQMSEGDLDTPIEPAGEDKVGRMMGSLEDIRKRFAEILADKARSEKEEREVISNISHDLRTPITSIKGYVEGIMDGVADTPEKINRYIKTIYNKANEMDHLINELTLYSRLDTNSIPYNYHMLNVREYFDDGALDIGLELESKGIELVYKNEVEPDVVIIADPEQLRRAVNNVIGNSIKYMERADGVITITITDIGDSVKVELSDNGKGIDIKDLPNIFDRFYRSDVSRNSSKMGSGIGLSIVKKIIEDHGGYIWATSGEGKGATINFTIHKYEDKDQ
ncbi:MAG: HAMP domain-containing histidine kinase [Lachnospiraceae bacterium]|nr:HAMP domain-containing histidine kinase [Lachnospiraceae bacterium]